MQANPSRSHIARCFLVAGCGWLTHLHKGPGCVPLELVLRQKQKKQPKNGKPSGFKVDLPAEKKTAVASKDLEFASESTRDSDASVELPGFPHGFSKEKRTCTSWPVSIVQWSKPAIGMLTHVHLHVKPTKPMDKITNHGCLPANPTQSTGVGDKPRPFSM